MSDFMREEFSEWLLDIHGLESEWQEARNCFKDFPAHLAYQAWQASRECLVIELPNRFDEKYQDYYDDVEGGCFNECRYISDVHASLEAAGVKYK